MGAIAMDLSGIGAPPAARPSVDMAGLAKRVWLLLYSEGGWWTAEEIRRNLRMDRDIWSALGEMVRSGFLARNRGNNIDGELVVKYGVTAKCKVPRGVVISEIEQLLQLVCGKQA